ncbi:hypothetical protein Tco_1141105 [Tanacetum coccineum]
MDTPPSLLPLPPSLCLGDSDLSRLILEKTLEQGETEKEIGLDHGCLLLPRPTNGKAIVVPVVRVNHVVKVKLSYPFKHVQIAIEAVTLIWS